MNALISAPDAEVIGGFLMLLGVLAAQWYQSRRVHRDNRSDHKETAEKVDTLLANVHEINATVTDTRADVRDVKADMREHDIRIHRLEIQ